MLSEQTSVYIWKNKTAGRTLPSQQSNLNLHNWNDRFLKSSREDIKILPIWRSLFFELVATAIFVLFSTIILANRQILVSISTPCVLKFSFSQGLAIWSVLWIFGQDSGAIVNPAITMGFLLTRRISLVRCILYIIVQFLGALCGSSIGASMTQISNQPFGESYYGVIKTDIRLSKRWDFTIEFFSTCFLMMVVMASNDFSLQINSYLNRRVSITAVYIVTSLGFAKLTTASMNPARSLAVAIVTGKYDAIWIYIFGPLLGAFIAAFCYDHYIHSMTSVDRLVAFLLAVDYDPDSKNVAKQNLWKMGENLQD